MSTFIIRSQGFFYTDEYYAPGEVFKQVVKQTFQTREAAEQACAQLVRKWVRSEPIGNYVFDDDQVVDAVEQYLRAEWPGQFDRTSWLQEAMIPEAATDRQVDEIVKRMAVTFAQVLEVNDAGAVVQADGSDDEDEDEDAGDDDDEDEEDEDDDSPFDEGELHFGPRR